MRGEQGLGLLHVGDRGRKGVVTDKKEYTKGHDGPKSLTCRGLQGFFNVNKTLLLDFFSFLFGTCLMDLPFMVRHPNYSSL